MAVVHSSWYARLDGRLLGRKVSCHSVGHRYLLAYASSIGRALDAFLGGGRHIQAKTADHIVAGEIEAEEP